MTAKKKMTAKEKREKEQLEIAIFMEKSAELLAQYLADQGGSKNDKRSPKDV